MISIVIPLHNECENLDELTRRIIAACITWTEPCEVLLVDDGSTDGTFDWCREFCRGDPRFKLVSFTRNFGHQAAISAGLDYAAGDRVVVMDGDLQDPPEVIGLLLARLAEGYEVAYGVRMKRKESVPRRAAYFLFYRLLAALTPGLNMPLDAGDFCAMDRRVVHAIRELPERHRFLRGLRAWVGFRQVGVEYARPARHAGRTKYAWKDCFALAGGAVLDFSRAPLHAILAVAALLLATAGALALPLWAGNHGSGIHGETQTPLFWSGFLAISGLQLLGLGIVAEYLGRLLLEVKRRPVYVIRETVGIAVRKEPGSTTP